jgi:hypothetical protein
MDDLRYVRNDPAFNGLVSPPRNGSRLPQPVTHDARTSLPRRFTTESGRVPTLSSLTAPRGPDQTQDYASVRSFSPSVPTFLPTVAA